ncbi:cytochrome c class I [Pseudopedobacter saltans DSM 12145]|uniref:Cytochrome c class I n=1 Tax=Pseudopedobacter saltans (strain ATCC 51119 / DSM 12145 / JCM 21818 / CCUG 39354 / LMG 10337 / NBRC 100064 / NCIMB 13643) TaxID=762903 RepID=F0S503_PSESL|nr:cytochrome c [Pseudopedobacter saltans]ADY54177.1 cytochrome c class I [Pseudopedobacter saltans DSM 12145]
MNRTIITTAILLATVLLIGSCGGGNTTSESKNTVAEQATSTTGKPDYDPSRGEGKFNDSNVKAGPLDATLAARGKAIAATKCNSCHKQTGEKLVGPGWKGVTERRSLPWIMNFITNPDQMIDKDPELQAQLEICLVRMPNQNLSDDEARSIVEYMRQNDGIK